MSGSNHQSEKSPKMQRKLFYHNLRKYLRECTQLTSVHGLHYITEKRSRLERVIWTFIIISSLSGCVYMICSIVNKFENSPIVVSFATKDTPIYEIPFPSVTICPESKCASANFNYTDVWLKYLVDNVTVDEADLKKFHYMSLLCEDDSEEKIASDGNKTVGDDFFFLMDELKPKKHLLCYYMGEEDKCYGYITPIITDVGICYSFNIIDRNRLYRDHVVHYLDFHRVVNDTKDFDEQTGYVESAGVDTYPVRALMSGADNALNMILGESEEDNDYACSKFFQGFRVVVHNPMDIPRPSKYYFRVPFDKTVVVAVQPKLIVTSEAVKKFKPESRECYMPDERYLKHFRIYTQENCMLECVTNYTLNNCGCVGFYMPRDNQTAVCGTANAECMEKAKGHMKIKELENKMSGFFKKGETHCDCKPLCTSLKYNVEISHSDFYWKKFFKLINVFDASKDDDDHLSVLSIYVKSEQFMTLERNELYGISDLISNFGGLLGLFTGFSLISLAELIYFLTLRIFCNDQMYGSWSGRG